MTSLSRTLVVLAAIAGMAIPVAANAQSPLRIVVPFPAGGISDSMARIVAKGITDETGESVIVEPHPGGSGLVAARHVINSSADGTTLFLSSPTTSIILPRIMNLEFDPLDSFIPVSNIGSSPMVLAVRSSLPVKTLKEFVDYVKGQEPGKLSIASGGTGTSTHLVPMLFFKRAGLELTHVPFKGGAPALKDLVAGHVDTYFGNPAEILPHAESGSIRILATSGESRLPNLPDVPTLAESYPGLSLVTWNGLVYPKGTPAEKVKEISDAIQAVSKKAEYQQALEKLGVDVIGDSSDHFKEFIQTSLPLWEEAIAAADIKKQ